jgi:hypothetical protein
VIAALLVAACVATDSRDVATTPDEAQFAPVAQFLVHRCGSLDCHGSPYRNLRLYGNEGLRLDPTARPMVPSTTTPEEIDADYQSVVGLEPEAMSRVVNAGGADPTQLSLMRKPSGGENHKGWTLIAPGDSQWVCLTSWLSGKTDANACTLAAQTRP